MAIEVKQMQIHSSVLPKDSAEEDDQDVCRDEEEGPTEGSLSKLRLLTNDIQRERRER